VPATVLLDDDSGPSLNAGVGLATGSPMYVASEAEDVVVQVTGQNGFSYGPFLLALGTRSAAGLPVTVQAVVPATARVGDVVTIMGTGFDEALADQHVVLVNGGSAPAWNVGSGSLEFMVPEGAKSGPVQVQTPLGSSAADPEMVGCWLCVHGFIEIYEIEGQVPAVSPGILVRGQLSIVADQDDVTVDLAAGESIAIECHPWDPGSGNITGGALLEPWPVDPELRILSADGAVTLAFDQNSGPSLGAGFGLHAGNPPFTAPYAGTYRIRVRAFFGWSWGDYVLAINAVP
jgi:hypothetical protein